MILFRDKCMEILGWIWGRYGLVIVLNEKIYYPRIILSYNKSEKIGCYSWYQREILFGDLGFVDDLEIVDLKQISRMELVEFICRLEVINWNHYEER